MTRRLILFFALLAVATGCPGAGKPQRANLVSFHLEGEETDNPKFNTPIKLGQDHRQYYFNKVPTLTDSDIAWFYPFTSNDGVSFGAAFKMKDHAVIKLKGITLTNQGKLLGIRCSTAQLQAVLIDRPIEDGVVVIWNGLQADHLKEFQKKFPHVDDFTPKAAPPKYRSSQR